MESQSESQPLTVTLSLPWGQACDWLDFMAEIHTRSYADFFCNALNHALQRGGRPPLASGAVVSATEQHEFRKYKGREMTRAVILEFEFSETAKKQLEPVISQNGEKEEEGISNILFLYRTHLKCRSQMFSRFPMPMYDAIYTPH